MFHFVMSRWLLLFFVLSLHFPTLYPFNLSAKNLEWEKLMPDTCVNNLNFTLPDDPIKLNVSLKVNAIYDISEERMEFGMQIDLWLFWRDPFLLPITGMLQATKKVYPIPQQLADCIWKPNIILPNAKTVELYRYPTVNSFYKLGIPSGRIIHKSRYKVVVACPMKFDYYPMDSQNCSLQISLYESLNDEVALEWYEDVYNISQGMDETPLNYAITPLPNTKSSYEYISVGHSSEFLHANYLFERSLSASLFNTYIPSTLVVCLSMVSFWLDIDAVPGRVTLGVTAILTLSTQIVQARSSLPVLDYMTALDVWLLGCLVMVFMSLIEFTLANSIARKLQSTNTVKPREDASTVPDVAWVNSATRKRRPLNLRRSTSGRVRKRVKPIRLADNTLDRISRVLFPVMGLCLGIVYWWYYYNLAYP